jgi:O-antigen/teichoic acid export membrane protein
LEFEPTPVSPPVRSAEDRRRLRLMIGSVLIVVAVLMVPWTLYLAVTLPTRHHAVHWDAVWVGFDVALVVGIAATAIGAFRRAGWLAIAATATGTLLLCDAWFDVLTSSGGGEATEALLQALVGELPLAVLCFWIAWNVERAREWSGVFRDRD